MYQTKDNFKGFPMAMFFLMMLAQSYTRRVAPIRISLLPSYLYQTVMYYVVVVDPRRDELTGTWDIIPLG